MIGLLGDPLGGMFGSTAEATGQLCIHNLTVQPVRTMTISPDAVRTLTIDPSAVRTLTISIEVCDE